MIIGYAFVIIAMVCILLKERSCLGCGTIFSTEDCDNKNGKAVIGTQPYLNDTKNNLLDKIKLAGNYTSRFVTWRGFLLTSFLITLALWFVIFKKMPTDWELITSMMIIFLGISMMSSFYKFHLSDLISKNIDNSVELLKNYFR